MRYILYILVFAAYMATPHEGENESLSAETVITEYSFSAADQPADLIRSKDSAPTALTFKPLRGSLKKIAEIVAVKHIIESTTVPFVLLATSEHIGAIGGREIFKELI